MRTMETHKHPQALVIRNMIILQSGTIYSTKEVVHGRPITIPTEAHFRTVGSSLRTLTFIHIKKKSTYDPSDTVVFISLLTKI